MYMEKDSVIFKGTNEGLYIYIKEATFENIKMNLKYKLEKGHDFFRGGKVIGFKGKTLTSKERDTLTNILKEDYGLKVDIIEPKVVKPPCSQDIVEGQTKFVRSTIRSGQSIKYDGNIVVLGDVNPGGEVIATGNIIIMGSLRGIVHAGSSGNKRAIIAAFKLKSKQLRIADIIARSPDNEISNPKWPELAKIKGDSIIIEPYLQKNN